MNQRLSQKHLLDLQNDHRVLNKKLNGIVEPKGRFTILADKLRYNLPLYLLEKLKQLDKDTILKSVDKTGFAVTVENHSIIGGLGSAIAECLSENYPAKLIRLGINDEFGQSGTPAELLRYYKLDGESIANRILEIKK